MSQAVQQRVAEIKPVPASPETAPASSGPQLVSPSRRVALNGITHAVTGQNMFLQESEYLAYMDLGRQYFAEFRPVGVRETQLAQKIVDLNWRLNTASAIENNLFHSSRAAMIRNNDPNPDRIVSMITKASVWAADCDGPQAFVKLGRYEAHLARTLTRATQELERLQHIRLRNSDTFDPATCAALLWYERMYSLFADATTPQTPARVNSSPSSVSDPELLCKKPEINRPSTTSPPRTHKAKS